MGRPPSEKPLSVLVSFRLDDDAAERLDVEVEAEKRAGMVISRNVVARVLMEEAIAARVAARKTKKTK